MQAQKSESAKKWKFLKQKNKMKGKLLFLFAPLMTVSCGIFLGENSRYFSYKMQSGAVVQLSISENRLPLTERRTLIVKSASDYPLRGRNCDDAELKKFSDEVWSEIAKNENLAEIKSATMMLNKEYIQATPKYCEFKYSRKSGDEWIED